MIHRRNHLLTAAFICAGMQFQMIDTAFAACAKLKASRPGEVYLLRGLANVFSLGMDEMGKKFSELNIENCVFNHRAWSGLANDIIERSYRNRVSYPIVIIGHSLGAGAAPQMATRLARQNIPVAYVAMFDPVQPRQIGGNVDELVNYYIEQTDKNKIVTPLPDFTGHLENINLAGQPNITHLNIDKNLELQGIVFQRAQELSDKITEEKNKPKLEN